MRRKHWFDSIRRSILRRHPHRKNANRRRPAISNLFVPLQFEVLEARALLAVDFGDLPDTGAGTGAGNYNTISTDNGPRHTIVAGLRMGANVSGELEALPNTAANGDDVAVHPAANPDDEDGLNNPQADLTLTSGAVPEIHVRVTNTTGSVATLSGWIDYNANGVFDNATERAQVAVPSGSNNVTKTLTFPAVPTGLTGKTYARFRLGTTAAAQDPTGNASNGEVEDYIAHIMLPSSGTVGSNVKISDGLAGFAPSSLDANDFFGHSMASLGDLDGDGVADLAVGAYGDENGQSAEGAVYVLLMNSNGTVKSHVKISDGLAGFTPSGLDANDFFGHSMASLGDLDGDGVTDLAVGALRDENVESAEGAVYVLLMNPNGTVKSHVKISDGLAGFAPNGLNESDFFGSSVASLGDLDGDGVADLAVGSYRDENGGSDEGAVYVLLMNSNGTVKSHVKISDGLAGFTPSGLEGDFFGGSLASLGDLDGDGVTDLAVGAPNDENTASSEGAVYVLLMNSNGTVKSHVKISNGLAGFTGLGAGDFFGSSLASLSDLDGDGVTDLAVGAFRDENVQEEEGAVYVLLMNNDGTVKSQVKISDGLAGFAPSGLNGSDHFGSSVASLGDVDGDGLTDLAVGAFRDENSDASEGAVYLLLAPKRFVVTNTSNSGAGSLRQAILDANNRAGLDEIRFNIPGAGPHSIAPTSALPTITDAVVIDGTSEPDFVAGGPPVVELNGTSAGAMVSGLKITAGGSTVRGIAINRFQGHGIELRTGSGNVIDGSFIGTSVGGTEDQGNALDGVLIVNSAGNAIGGTTPTKRNVISGNNRYGIEIINSTSTANLVQGNFIGTNEAGTGALGNSLSGVAVYSASSNSIGGTATGAGNRIAFNGQIGVRVTGTGTSNPILQNSIFTNTALGIDLNGDGVTANDVNDPDTGPNKRQNFPVITSAVKSGSNLNITFSVPSSAANSSFPLRVEFFIADAVGQEGRTFLGSSTYTTPGEKTIAIPAGAAVLGTKIVATATDNDGNGNTSEFSASRTVTNPLLVAGGAAPARKTAISLSSRQLQLITDAAIARLSSQGLTSVQVNQLKSVRVDIADLPGTTLGLAAPGAITLDAKAAGFGWFIDPTPFDDAEFSAPKSQISNLKSMDLLTAVMHEFGHLLGHDDSELFRHNDVVSATLAPGIRRTEFAVGLDKPTATRSTHTTGKNPTVRDMPLMVDSGEMHAWVYLKDIRRKKSGEHTRSGGIENVFADNYLDRLFTDMESWF